MCEPLPTREAESLALMAVVALEGCLANGDLKMISKN
jgi:hypothetical protein